MMLPSGRQAALVLAVALIVPAHFRGADADIAYGLNCDTGGAQNATVIGIDTSIPANVSRIELPFAACGYFGCVLNLGSRVFAGVGGYVVQVDPVNETVARTYHLPSVTQVSSILLDPKNSSRMFVLDLWTSLWTLDLDTGTATLFIDHAVLAFQLRPGTRQLFVADSTFLRSFDADTGKELNSTSIAFSSSTTIDFLDSDILLLHGHGFGRYTIDGSIVTPVCEIHEYDEWGYDSMLASDGERFVHPTLTSSIVRNASNCSVIAHGVPEDTPLAYSTLAAGPDGTYLMTNNEDPNDYVNGFGVLMVGQQDANFSYIGRIEMPGDSFFLKGHPYEYRDPTAATTAAATATTTTTSTITTTTTTTTVTATTAATTTETITTTTSSIIATTAATTATATATTTATTTRVTTPTTTPSQTATTIGTAATSTTTSTTQAALTTSRVVTTTPPAVSSSTTVDPSAFSGTEGQLDEAETAGVVIAVLLVVAIAVILILFFLCPRLFPCRAKDDRNSKRVQPGSLKSLKSCFS